jgi:hypothetical protein
MSGAPRQGVGKNPSEIKRSRGLKHRSGVADNWHGRLTTVVAWNSVIQPPSFLWDSTSRAPALRRIMDVIEEGEDGYGRRD